MSAPVLTVHGDAAPCPRVEVFFEGFVAGTASVTVFRISGGKTFEVRGAVRAPTADTFTRVDFEVPFNVQVSYRAEQFDASGLSLGFTETSSLGADMTEWAVTRRNLVEHPTPVDVSEWISTPPSGTFSVDTDVVRREGVGTYSRTLTAASATLLNATVTPVGTTAGAYAVTEGAHLLSGYVYSTVPVSRVLVSFSVYDAGGTPVGAGNVFDNVNAPANTWVRFSAAISVPAGGALIVPTANIQAATSAPIGTRTWLTDVLLERGTEVRPFFHADMPSNGVTRYRWEGEPNNSPTVEESRGVASAGIREGSTWMHNPLNPQGSVRVTLLDTAVKSLSRQVPGEVSYPRGRRVGVVLSEPRRGLGETVFDVFVETHADADKVQALIGGTNGGAVPVVCIRTGSDNPMRVAMPLFLGVFDIPEEDVSVRFGGEETIQRIKGPEVDPPLPGLYVPLLRRKDLNAYYGSRAALNASALTRSDVNRQFELAGYAGD